MKIRYDFLRYLAGMHENKTFFFAFLFYNFFCNVLPKIGILISDLYFYSIKIQTNFK
jgi:hypothetical protein